MYFIYNFYLILNIISVPTHVICLINMISAYEIDEDLE